MKTLQCPGGEVKLKLFFFFEGVVLIPDGEALHFSGEMDCRESLEKTLKLKRNLTSAWPRTLTHGGQ